MTTLDKLKSNIMPAVVAGVGSLGVYYFMYGGDSIGISVPVFGMSMPTYAAVGGSVAIGYLGGEVLSEFVLDKLPAIDALGNVQEQIVPPLMAGFTTYAVMKSGISEYTPLKDAMIIGAGGSLAGKYIYGMI